MIAFIVFLCVGGLVTMYLESDPDYVIENYCEVSVYSSVIGLNGCDVDGDEFNLIYSTGDDGHSFTIETVYSEYEVDYWYYVANDGTVEYTVHIEDTSDGSICNYQYYDGEEHTASGGNCSVLFGTKSARDYAMELLDDFTELLGFEDYDQLAEYLEDYIAANLEE